MRIPINVFDVGRRQATDDHPADPNHENLEPSTLFHFCVQSDVNPPGVVKPGKNPDPVNGRFLFCLCLRVRLNEDDPYDRFVEGTTCPGNTSHQIEILANWHQNGFRIAGRVSKLHRQPLDAYLAVGDGTNVYTHELATAIIRLQD